MLNERLDWEDFKQMCTDEGLSPADLEYLLTTVNGVNRTYLFAYKDDTRTRVLLQDGDVGYTECNDDYIPSATEFTPPS